MIATTHQIDAAIEAYQREREPHGDSGNHRDALGEALRTVRPLKAIELLTAETAYGQHRSPARWDGVPWGECGTKNHRAGIRAALSSLDNIRMKEALAISVFLKPKRITES